MSETRAGYAVPAGSYVVEPLARTPVWQLVGRWVAVIGVVAAIMVGLPLLMTKPSATYACPPNCGRPPTGKAVETNPRFTAPDGALWLLWTAQRGGNQDTALIRRRISRDGGERWSPIETLIPEKPGFGTFIRSRIVVNARGEWLLPIWRKRPIPGSNRSIPMASCLSSDETKRWRNGGP